MKQSAMAVTNVSRGGIGGKDSMDGEDSEGGDSGRDGESGEATGSDVISDSCEGSIRGKVSCFSRDGCDVGVPALAVVAGRRRQWRQRRHPLAEMEALGVRRK
jgi:hypothetical protein